MSRLPNSPAHSVPLPLPDPDADKKQASRQLTALVVINCFLASGILVFLLFAGPVLAAMFEDFGARLPAPTRALLACVFFMKRWWWLVVPSAAGALTFLGRRLDRDDLIGCLKISLVVTLIAALSPWRSSFPSSSSPPWPPPRSNRCYATMCFGCVAVAARIPLGPTAISPHTNPGSSPPCARSAAIPGKSASSR
jgi:hypothetical protein